MSAFHCKEAGCTQYVNYIPQINVANLPGSRGELTTVAFTVKVVYLTCPLNHNRPYQVSPTGEIIG